jgi:hypothetical protein
MSVSTPPRDHPAPSSATMQHLEIDGVPVGPDFAPPPDSEGEDSEAAHRWMAIHHPGSGYSIVSSADGHCCRRANYAAAEQPHDVDYGVW